VDQESPGQKEGIEVLAKYLATDEIFLLSELLEALASYCVRVLRAYTGENFGYDIHRPLSERRQAISSWQKWWAENIDRLVWDNQRGQYGQYVIEKR
jgi:hypothetical protein